MKVLVIEDDPSLREIICRSLEKERYVTEEAPDFHTALEKAADYTYDCILLDIMLPDGNELDLLEELKKENKKEKIQKIANDWFAYADETKNYGFFKRILEEYEKNFTRTQRCAERHSFARWKESRITTR